MVTPISSNPTQLTSLMIREIAEIQTKDKEFESAVRRLKKNYTLKKLGNLQKRYITKPQKFKEKLREFTDNFVEDYENFRQKYTDLFKTIVQTIDVSGREHSVELQKVEELIDEIVRKAAANPEQFFFPVEAKQKFRDEFKKAIQNLATQLKIEYAQFQGARSGRRIRTGFLSRFMNVRSAARTGTRKAKKLLEEVEMIQQISQEIEEELNSGIRQDFIALLLQYVVALEKTDDSLKKIKKDIIIIMDDVIDEVREVIQEIGKTMVVMDSDPQAKPKIESAREEFHRQQAEVIRILGEETKWPRFEISIAQKLSEKERELISTLTSINERHIKGKAQNIINRELGPMGR